jgi:hypothetical protein
MILLLTRGCGGPIVAGPLRRFVAHAKTLFLGGLPAAALRVAPGPAGPGPRHSYLAGLPGAPLAPRPAGKLVARIAAGPASILERLEDRDLSAASTAAARAWALATWA